MAINGRITPACAGNIPRPFALGSLTQDHPRMRGEHIKNSLITGGFYSSACCNSMSLSYSCLVVKQSSTLRCPPLNSIPKCVSNVASL